MAPLHFQGSAGGGQSCAQRISLMLPKKPSRLVFLQHSHPLPPKLLPVRVQGPPGASESLEAPEGPQGFFRGLQGVPPRRFAAALRGHRKHGCDGRGLALLGLGYSHQGENQCTLYTFGSLNWLLCFPIYGKSLEGLYTFILCSTGV